MTRFRFEVNGAGGLTVTRMFASFSHHQDERDSRPPNATRVGKLAVTTREGETLVRVRLTWTFVCGDADALGYTVSRS
jgi:hypothetical protein